MNTVVGTDNLGSKNDPITYLHPRYMLQLPPGREEPHSWDNTWFGGLGESSLCRVETPMTTQNTRQFKRRRLLQATSGSLVVGGVGSSIVGLAAAENEHHRFIVIGQSNTASRIAYRGFDVMHSLAGGQVLIVIASADEQDDLQHINGVQHVIPDIPIPMDSIDVGSDTEREFSSVGSDVDEPIFWDEQWDKRLMDVPEAHETATGDGVRVAVIDTGIEPHPDLTPNLNADLSVRFKNGEEITEEEPHDAHPFGHGTQVAGVIASSGFGTVGVAPDAELVSINIYQDDLPEGEWTPTDLLVSLDYAREVSADVINMSLLSIIVPPKQLGWGRTEFVGFRAALERLTNMLVRNGSVMAASAGNFGVSIQTGEESYFPGGMQGVLNVSSSGPNDKLAYYSVYGSRWIDVAAPGGMYETATKTWCTGEGLILTCEDADDDPVDPLELEQIDDCECTPADLPAFENMVLTTSPAPPPPGFSAVWERASGTSTAAPQVAGVAALVKAANPNLNPRQIEQVLKRSAESEPGQGDSEFGAGRVNAAMAVAEATK